MLTGFVINYETSPPETQEIRMMGGGAHRVVTSKPRVTLTVELENADFSILAGIMSGRVQIQPVPKLPDAFAPPAGETEILTKPVDRRDEPSTTADSW